LSVADDLTEALSPWIATGPELEDLARALGSMFAEVEAYALDEDDDAMGWGGALDPDVAPYKALAWLAQWAGERIPPGLPDLDARRWIKDNPNARRGTETAIARAAQRGLDPASRRTVQILRRTLPDGDPDPDGDNFMVITYTSDTPDPNRVWVELLTVIPADMVCTYQTVAGATWAGAIAADGPTWNDIETAFPTWDQVKGSTPGATVWEW
jgi:hypothetical protein